MFKYNMKFDTKQRYNSIQGLRSFKNALPTKVKKIISKIIIFILNILNINNKNI